MTEAGKNNMAKINSLIEKINGGDNALFNELYGTEVAVLKEQADRYAALMTDFEITFGHETSKQEMSNIEKALTDKVDVE